MSAVEPTRSAEFVPLPEGTRVRALARSACGDADIDPGAAVVGREYDVCAYPAPGEGDDEIGRGYYLLDSEGSYGGSHWAYPEDIEVVMTVEAKAARKLPTFKDLRDSVSSAVIGMHGAVDVREIDTDADNAFMAYGTTEEGLNVGFRVSIDMVQEVDW